jgi:hypothetical protein
VKDNFFVRTSALPSLGGGANRGGGTHSKVSTFDVILYSEDEMNSILMNEFPDHDKAVAFMQKYSEKLSLPARNIYRELQASAVSRRAGMRR